MPNSQDNFFRQKELADWQLRNFGESDLRDITLGVCEESGELAHHVLKGVQGIRGGVNGFDNDKIVDSAIDTIVFCVQVLSKLNVDATTAYNHVVDQVVARDWKNNKQTGDSMGRV